MRRIRLLPLVVLVIMQFSLCCDPLTLAQAGDWRVRVKPKGTLKVVDLFMPAVSVVLNYAEAYVPY
jgi:hypothetical protein